MQGRNSEFPHAREGEVCSSVLPGVRSGPARCLEAEVTQLWSPTLPQRGWPPHLGLHGPKGGLGEPPVSSPAQPLLPGCGAAGEGDSPPSVGRVCDSVCSGVTRSGRKGVGVLLLPGF